MLIALYKIYLNLLSKRKQKIFRKNAKLGKDVVIGCGSNAFVEPGGALVIGDDCEINARISVKAGAKVEIGHHTTTRGANIGAVNSITIGNYVIISNSVTIYDNNNHPTSEVKRMEMSQSGFHGQLWKWSHSSHAPIVIEDNVWVGQGVVILKGVTIGHGSVVAMNSVVTKSVPPHSIVAGNPAKVVKFIPESERLPE